MRHLASLMAALAILMATIIHVRASGKPGVPNLLPVVVWQLAVWSPWIIFGWLMARLANRYPYGSVNSVKWITLHAGAAISISTAHLFWYWTLSDTFSPYHGVVKTKYGVFAYFFIFWYLLDLVFYFAVLAWLRSRELSQLQQQDRKRIEELHRALAEQQQGPSTNGVQIIPVRRGRREHMVPVEEVLWIEAQGYYVGLHTNDDMFLTRESMTSLSRRLDAQKFIRVHRSTIANVRFIRHLELDESKAWVVVLADGTRRRVSRSGKQRLERVLAAIA